MKLLQINLHIAILSLFISCSKYSKKLTDPDYEIDFQIERTNSDNDYQTSVDKIISSKKFSSWRTDRDGKTQISREIELELKLSNGDTITFGFWFIKYEDDSEILVLENGELNPWERSWDYVSTDLERENFFNEFDEARVLVNGNVIFHKEMNDHFSINSVKPALEEGQEKSYVHIDFSGDAFGFYDPSGLFQEVFTIRNGVFKGIIE